MLDHKRYIISLRWIIFLLSAAVFLLIYLKNPGFISSKSIKILLILAVIYTIYSLIVTVLYKTHYKEDLFYYYSLFGDFVFGLILISLTGIQASPFMFLFYLIIIAAGSLEVDRNYKIAMTLLIPVSYLFITIASGSVTSDFVLFIGNLAGLTLTVIAGLILSERISQKKTTDEHLKKLQEAYNLSRQQAKEKEEKELVLIDKSQKLLSLIEITRSMGATARLDELLELIVTKARDTLNTKISFLMLIKERELVVAYSLGLSELTKNLFKSKLGEGVLGASAVKNQIVNINIKDNPDETGIFFNAFERIKNMLCVPLKSPQDKKLIGLLGVANLLVEDKFTEDHSSYLYTLATDASIFVKNKLLFEELEKSYIEMIQALAQAVEARDPYTYGHIDRVKNISLLIAKRLGANQAQLELIKTGAVLHDLGKIGTPDNILLKPGALTDDERNVMQQHVTNSTNILRDISSLHPKVLDIVKHHHERYDGEGYPDRLKGDDIPVESQIVAIADTFDAMTSDRPYRKGMPHEKAVALLKEAAGTQFNPKLVDIFITLYNTGELKGHI
ncbi:MAG: HD domain-containing phosphohydrolase [Armatimonadota bacterium]